MLPKDLLNDDGYALFHLKPNSSKKVRFENLTDPFSDLNRDDFLRMGINSVYGSNTPFLISNQKKIIKENLFKQLKEIVNKNKLITYNSDIILLEKISLILYYYHRKLGYEIEPIDYYLPRLDQIYPINLKELRNKLYKIRANYHYKHRKGMSSPLLDQKVEEAFKTNKEIPKLCFGGEIAIFEELFKIVNILLKRGYNEIKNHHLPYPDKSVIEAKELNEYNLNKLRTFQYSEDQAKLYIETFFKHLENVYQKFVEDLFPTFKKKFSFYKNIPHEYFFYMKDSDILKQGMFGYRRSTSEINKFYYYDIERRDQAFEDDQVSILRPFSLDAFLINEGLNTVQLLPNMKITKADDFCVIRGWVYKILRSDLEKFIKKKCINM
ncbi:Uncharacterised protein [Chryseobacterium nakagawai]|uniref:hypothetical protein n=1 Tax=Chryseobacterium nakagawai TaxID=1241982 RepID=UPI000F70BD32|nr:hypothetical protein [Chryseobacterium nakagawai]VEH21488.1 Uncharacterised protein [Chryseobacterium nakagawai]